MTRPSAPPTSGARSDLPSRMREDIPATERDRQLRDSDDRDAEGGRNSGPASAETRQGTV